MGRARAAFSAKVVDVHELLAEHEPQAVRHPIELRAAYHDACHLAHAQGVRTQPRELLRAIPGLELLEPAEWELCCGSAGIYNLLQPEAAAKLGARKAENLRATGAEAIAAANPGCALQIAAHLDLPIYHPMTLLDHVTPRSRTVSSLDAAPPPDERARRRSSPTTRCAFVGELHERFGPRRAGAPAGPRASAARRPASWRRPRTIRNGDWQVPPPRPDYEDRRVEITGPTDRKLVINALNCGAKGFMADFEDANSPTWRNQVEGHVNLIDAIEGTITYDGADGRHYELIDNPATLLVRPRGWHLPEKHLHGRRRARRRAR